MPYTPIVATLGYVMSPDGKEVLLIHRDRRPDDHHYGKYNGLGGKVERDEDVVAGMKREIMEEAGIECNELSLRGTISWPGFGHLGPSLSGCHPADRPMGALLVVHRAELIDQCLELVEVRCLGVSGEPFRLGLMKSFDFAAGLGVIRARRRLRDTQRCKVLLNLFEAFPVVRQHPRAYPGIAERPGQGVPCGCERF